MAKIEKIKNKKITKSRPRLCHAAHLAGVAGLRLSIEYEER